MSLILTFNLTLTSEFENFFSQPGHLIMRRLGKGGRGLPGNHVMTKENQGKKTRTNDANIILLLTNWTEIKSLTEHKRKKTNLINIYGTHLWHKYAAVGLATFFLFF